MLVTLPRDMQFSRYLHVQAKTSDLYGLPGFKGFKSAWTDIYMYKCYSHLIQGEIEHLWKSNTTLLVNSWLCGCHKVDLLLQMVCCSHYIILGLRTGVLGIQGLPNPNSLGLGVRLIERSLSYRYNMQYTWRTLFTAIARVIIDIFFGSQTDRQICEHIDV